MSLNPISVTRSRQQESSYSFDLNVIFGIEDKAKAAPLSFSEFKKRYPHLSEELFYNFYPFFLKFRERRCRLFNLLIQMSCLPKGCFPSYADLAWKSGYSERQVIRIMKEWKRIGLITWTFRPYKSNMYTLSPLMRDPRIIQALIPLFPSLEFLPEIPIPFLPEKLVPLLSAPLNVILVKVLNFIKKPDRTGSLLKGTNARHAYARAQEKQNLITKGKDMDKKRILLQEYLEGRTRSLPILEEVKGLKLPFTEQELLKIQVFDLQVLKQATLEYRKAIGIKSPFKLFCSIAHRLSKQMNKIVDHDWEALELTRLVLGEFEPRSPDPVEEKKEEKKSVDFGSRAAKILGKMTDEDRKRLLEEPWSELTGDEKICLHMLLTYEREDTKTSYYFSDLKVLLESRIPSYANLTIEKQAKASTSSSFLQRPPEAVLEDWARGITRDPNYIKRFHNNPLALTWLQEYLKRRPADATSKQSHNDKHGYAQSATKMRQEEAKYAATNLPQAIDRKTYASDPGSGFKDDEELVNFE